MLMDLNVATRLRAMSENRTGVMMFECEALSLFDNLEAILEERFRADIIKRAYGEQQNKPGLMSQILTAVGGDFGESVGEAHAESRAKAYWQNTKALCGLGQFRRAVADLDDREVAVLSAASAQTLAMSDHETEEELLLFLFGVNARLVWAGGRTQFLHSDEARSFPAEAMASEEVARGLMAHFINSDEASYRQDLGDLLGQYVEASQNSAFREAYPKGAAAIADALSAKSTAWATSMDIESDLSPFKRFEPGQDLFLGMIESPDGALPIGFSGNESLVTVAQPGAGKTQCHILPNLLTYDGPLIVLDPKLELLELTAGFRQSEGKRILVLNLADDEVATHRFNLMEFIDQRPEFMWHSLVELSEFLLPPTAGDSSPIFRAKGAELFAVCLGGEMLESAAAERHPTINGAISRVFSSIESLKNWLYDTEHRAADLGCAPLEQSAVAFAALANNPNTVEDFQRFQTNATAALTKFRGGVIDRVAGGEGDWMPEDLRRPGCTLYIRVPYEEMQVYGGFVRLVLHTIIKRLRKGATEQGGLPVTFLLDEVAQLGNLDQIANVVETGRGFGLRAWMILQDYDQARAATNTPNLILKTPKVRLFMNPSLETAREMTEELGVINQVITGTYKPLAETSELMGEPFANDIVVLSSGAKPLRLFKHFMWQEDEYEALISHPFKFELN